MKMNKKGFTLVELLAVIVVLALLMVVATTSIGTALSNSKKKALITEAQKLLNSNFSEEQSKRLLNASSYTGATVTSTEGDYVYKITFNTAAQITSYCVSLPSDSISVSNASVTASDSVPVVNAVDTTYKTCS